MRFFLCAVFLMFTSLACGQEVEVINKAVKSSIVVNFIGTSPVTKKPTNGMVSGVVFNKIIEGKEESFILSCSHGISNLEQDFTAVMYVQPLSIKLNIKPIMFSSAIGGTDVVLYYSPANLKSYIKMAEKRAVVGEKIFHVGTPANLSHFNSAFDGIVSRHDARVQPSPDPKSVSFYDTGSYTTQPGCSGGGVFNKEGDYIGMALISLSNGGWSGYHSVDKIKKALDINNMSWLYDGSEVKIEDIKKIKLTNISAGLKVPKPTPLKDTSEKLQ